MLGGGVSACDALRGDEDADAAIGPRAGGNAREGRVVASGPLLHDGTSLQRATVQLFRFSEGGGTSYEHGASGGDAFRKTRHLVAGNVAAVFGVVKKSCKISVHVVSTKQKERIK